MIFDPELDAAILDAVENLIVVVDPTGTVVRMNQAAEQVTGYSRAEAIGRNFWDIFVAPDEVAAARDRLAQVIAGNWPRTYEREWRARDGSRLQIRWTTTVVRDRGGRPRLVIGAGADITERKRAERELLFRKSLLESQIEASIDGVLVVDTHGKILLYNTRFASMWGIPADVLAIGSDAAAIGAVLDQLREPDEFLQRIAWLYRHPEEQSSEEIHLKDGRAFDRFSAPVRSPGGANQVVYYGRVWHFHDITDLKHAEASARQAAELARESAQIARRSEAHYRQAAEHNRRLAREIDHRVGNNLAALLGLVEATRRRASTVDALADAIQNRLRAMAQVHQLLREGQWRRVSLAELIASARAAIDQQPQAATEFHVDGPEVWIEPHQVPALTMVLVELLTNSAKHGVHRGGGRLSLTWEIVPDDSAADSRPRLRAAWLERGGPPIVDPVVPSLGTELVEGFITRELLGRCVLRYPPQGADHLIEFPLASPQAPPAEPA